MEKTLAQLLDALRPDVRQAVTVALAASPAQQATPGQLAGTRVTSLEFDSRKVTPGTMFFALPGTHVDGISFIPQAIRSGASCVVMEGSVPPGVAAAIGQACGGRDVPLVLVPSARVAMSPFAAAFYDNPSQKLVVYGVTGTEGKSSTVSFIWQLLRAAGITAGFISTVQYSLGGAAVANPEHQTTPEATIVQRELYEMVQNGCTHAVVESSSHGLSERLGRLGDVQFDCAAFMNVTLEHLEFHKTFEQYRSDKANLFRALDTWSHHKTLRGQPATVTPVAVANAEDGSAAYFCGATHAECVLFGVQGADTHGVTPQAVITGVRSDSGSVSFTLNYAGGGAVPVRAPTPGAFNAHNITAAMLCVHKTTGIALQTLAGFAAKLESVRGRMTVIDQGQPFEVIVDYAHTPSSFSTIFPPIRKRCSGRIIALFGSGGERDVTKRPLQGEVAATYCDVLVLTDEDPRGEDSVALLEQIAGDKTCGARKCGKVDGVDLHIIPDRPSAIRAAFGMARAGDIVLLLGKSHENSIIYKDHVMPYDEIAQAQKTLGDMGFAHGRRN